jgi:hypothetical protein
VRPILRSVPAQVLGDAMPITETEGVKCLCCGQWTRKRGNPVTPEQAAIGLRFLERLGYTREMLLEPENRKTLEFTSPGMVEWLETQAPH